eukprot:SAG31_NODE_39639_length_286_cov_1.828877_1_plen_88_part_10
MVAGCELHPDSCEDLLGSLTLATRAAAVSAATRRGCVTCAVLECKTGTPEVSESIRFEPETTSSRIQNRDTRSTRNHIGDLVPRIQNR